MPATPNPASQRGSSLARTAAGTRLMAAMILLSTHHRNVGVVLDVERPPAPGGERALQIAERREVVDGAEADEALPHRRAAEEVARQHRDHRRADAEILARLHEDVAQARV